jgi:SMC interacting uncharacterized protein involved in chromosome segregation
MIATESAPTQLDEQISALQSEIRARKTDIKNLEEALQTLISGKSRPANPESDNAFELLKQLIGDVPQNLEQEQIYSAKLQEAQRALQLAIAACEQKENQLRDLEKKQSELQAIQLFEELKVKGEQFNSCVIELLKLFNEIKETSKQISSLRGDNCLTVIGFERREIPWFTSSSRTVAFLRKFEASP